MATFATEELISATKFVKNFSYYSNKINSGELEKIGVLRNNQLNMTIIPSNVYDFFENLLENLEIYKQISLRKNKEDFVHPNEVLDEFGISLRK